MEKLPLHLPPVEPRSGSSEESGPLPPSHPPPATPTPAGAAAPRVDRRPPETERRSFRLKRTPLNNARPPWYSRDLNDIVIPGKMIAAIASMAAILLWWTGAGSFALNALTHESPSAPKAAPAPTVASTPAAPAAEVPAAWQRNADRSLTVIEAGTKFIALPRAVAELEGPYTCKGEGELYLGDRYTSFICFSTALDEDGFEVPPGSATVTLHTDAKRRLIVDEWVIE
jgi:hypothetical protein